MESSFIEEPLSRQVLHANTCSNVYLTSRNLTQKITHRSGKAVGHDLRCDWAGPLTQTSFKAVLYTWKVLFPLQPGDQNDFTPWLRVKCSFKHLWKFESTILRYQAQRLLHLLPVLTWTWSVRFANHMGHSGFITNKCSQMDWLWWVIFGKSLHFTPMSLGPLLGIKSHRSMTRGTEFSVRLEIETNS